MALEYLTFYQDRFRGGTTGGGFSLPYATGAYSGTITVNIPSTSTIRKAYLFAGRQGPATPINVNFAGSPAPFNPSNQIIVPNFQQPQYGGNSSVHIRDVTNQITPGTNTYSISIPSQSGPQVRYSDFYLLVTFNEPSFPFINCYAFVNKLSFGTNLLTYPITVSTPIGIANPVGLSVMCGDVCVPTTTGPNPQPDGYIVGVNATTLGTIYAHNPNTPSCPTCLIPPGTCAGPHGDFYYYNNVFNGINGCSNNQAMAGPDALSNIQGILANGATSFNLTMTCTGTNNIPINSSNATWAIFLAYMDFSDLYECAAQCGGYSVTNLFSTQATLNWSVNCPFTFNSFVNTIQYRPVGNPVWTVIPSLIGNTSYTITGLTPGTNYEWQVINLDTDGTQCPPSMIQFFSTP